MAHICRDGRAIRSLLPRQVRPGKRVPATPYAYSVKADISFNGKTYVVAISRKVSLHSEWEWTHSNVFFEYAPALRRFHVINEMGKRWEASAQKGW